MYGKLIKAILKKYDLSQVELGKSLTLSESFMSRLAHDKAPLPKNRQIQLTEKYNVNPAYFLKGEGKMFLNDIEEKELTEEVNQISEMLKANPENTALIIESVFFSQFF